MSLPLQLHYDRHSDGKDSMTRSYGGGPDRPPRDRDKQPELRESEPDFDSRLDSRLSRYEADEDTRVQAVRVDFGKRLVALIIDVGAIYLGASVVNLIPFAGGIVTQNLVTVLLLLTRDYFFEGRGLGKNLMGLQVVDVKTGFPCSFVQAVRRNIVILGPLLLFSVIVILVNIIDSFVHMPGNVHEAIYQVVNTIGALWPLVIIPYEAYRVYSRADGRRFGDTFAGTAVVEAPMDFSKPVPRQ
jgi:uncharacterized RDD family membrane protein YckC